VSRRVVSLPQTWADRLGIDTADGVSVELVAHFEHLARFVLGGEMRPAGEVSAEAATACGDLWVLDQFLNDARRAINGQEATR
jgi:hypothetical protein